MLTVSPMTTSGTKCYLYFDEYTSIKDTLQSYYPTVRTRTNFNSTVTDTTTGVIYKSADSSQYDNDGEVYYFAGNPTDNWVYFAGFYWRIIRINGDGSIRLIYHGTSTDATESNAQIKIEDNNIFSFNTTINDNIYVGFKYTNGEVHGTQIDSTIKLKLDEWYDNNLMLYENTLNINSGFCNDRTLYSGTGIDIDNTYYSPYDRLVTKTTPTLKCDTNDLFTDTLSTKGNKSLTNPVGLITADEVAFAGAVYAMSNSSYYLYTGTYFWTISPHSYSRSNVYANVFSVDMDGAIGYRQVNYEYGVRPVINLRSDVTISSGNGTASQPFVINTV